MSESPNSPNESDISLDTMPTSARPSATEVTSESQTTVDMPQEDSDGEDSSSDFPSTSIDRGRRRSYRRKQGFVAFVRRVVRSDPKEYRCLKACITFPIGALISLGLFYSVIYPLQMQPATRNLLGGCLGVALSLGFAFSVEFPILPRGNDLLSLHKYGPRRIHVPVGLLLKMAVCVEVGTGIASEWMLMEHAKRFDLEKYVIIFFLPVRCVVCLVLPTFFGKAGRSYITAFAVVFLVSGPIQNIVSNCREVARSLSCLAELLANHTLAKLKLRLHPLKDALVKMQEEGFMINSIGKAVESAFAPFRKELEDDSESEKMKTNVKEAEKIIKKNAKSGPPPNPFSADDIEKKHEIKAKDDKGKQLEEKWEKKADLRCEDVFSRGIVRCRNWFGDLEKRCMDALWVLGYVLCLPLKMTFFCELVRIVPGALGLDCDSSTMVDPGLGETFIAARDMIVEIAHGMKVRLQYKLVMSSTDETAMTAQEIRKGAMNEFESKAQWVEYFMLLVKRLLAFTFLLIFKQAYSYHKGYLTKFQHDNVYLTYYFRKIDARRKAAGKMKLLPLKKAEKQNLIFPSSLTLIKREKAHLGRGTSRLLFRLVLSGIIMYVDYILAYVLDIITRHSKIEYHQRGENHVQLTVYGTGFMAEIVRMFLTSFNSHHKLDTITTNHACLPQAARPNLKQNAFILVIYLGLWFLMYFEAYGLRLRRLISSFFYRKREKKRVLFLYNELLKKRKGYLQAMRRRVRKQVRERKLMQTTGVLNSLRLQFPRLCWCLKFFKASKDSCLICKDPEAKDFIRCPTPECGWSYCSECWKDVKRRCYVCRGKPDSGFDSGSSSESSSDSSDLSDDEHFLHF